MPRALIPAAASAALLTLPYHFSALWPLAFIAFIPFFYAAEEARGSALFRLSFLFGFFHYLALGYWLGYVNVLGLLLLAAYLALYFTAFGHAASSFFKSHLMRHVFFTAAVWTFLEYVRGWALSGFPWALLGYSQWKNTAFIQIADIAGAYGVSFIVMLVNVLLYRILRRMGGKPWRPVLCLAATLALTLGYGFWRLEEWKAFYGSEQPKAVLRLSVVQGNIPQDQKWDARIKSIIFEKYKRLTLMASMGKPDLILWPETSFPGFLEEEALMAAHLRGLVRQTRSWMLVGAPTAGDPEQSARSYNSAILYDPSGEESARYSKVHLVPFGEYVPFEPLLGFIRHFVSIGRFHPGAEQTLFSIVSQHQTRKIAAKFGVLICYEDIFPELVRRLALDGADFLVNVTNDAWFGKTSAPYQHAQASVFRAVENRLPVVRATNTGFSCFIGADGKIISSVQKDGVEIMVSGHQACDLTLRKGRPFFTRAGHLFFWAVAVLLFMAWRDKRKRSGYSRL